MVTRHCDVYKAKDANYYARLEAVPGAEVFTYYGPFASATAALDHLQRSCGIGNQFYLDETGRRPVPAPALPVA